MIKLIEFELSHESEGVKKRLLSGIYLTNEVSPKLRAKICCIGELCSSNLGKEILKKELYIYLYIRNEDVLWIDSRELLYTSNSNSNNSDSYLEADVEPRCDSDNIESIVNNYSVVICQVFF